MSASVSVGSPAHVPAYPEAVYLHAAACNALQRALRELRNPNTDYHQAAEQAHAALNDICRLGFLEKHAGVVQ